MRRLALALAVALSLGVTGCLTFAEGDGPLMAIELYWEEPSDDDRDHRGDGLCRSAGVYDMEWTLYDEDGREVDGRGEACADAIDVIDPSPGVYELEITGFDRDGDARWAVCCTGLRVLRFDIAYACDIPDVGSVGENEGCFE